jgi:hypothetical protein
VNWWVRWLPVAFLNDLDALASVATLAAIVVFCSVTFLNLRDWRNHWTVDFEGRIPIIAYLGVALIIGAIHSYSPNAHAPRKSVEGIARLVGETSGKGGYYKYICATSCELTGGYALALHNEAARITRIGSNYVFTYLEHPVGNAFSGISLRVTTISDPDSGRVLYALDLTNHPYRVALYLFDTALLVSAGLLGGLLNRSRRRGDAKEGTSNEEEEEKAERSGPISLGLESRDGD